MLFLTSNYAVAQADTVQTNSGLKYVILQPGKGPFAAPGNKVSVHFTGKLKNGRIFDTSAIDGKPVKIKVGAGDVIEAWEEILLKMQVGTKLILLVPTELAYGSAGLRNEEEDGYLVPPDQDILFEMELLKIKD